MKKTASGNSKVRKVFVRNSIVPALPRKVVEQKKRVHYAEDVDEEPSAQEQTDLSSPEFCSILKLAEEIKRVQLKSSSDIKKSDVGKCSKQVNVNFEPGEKLYQGLISLEKPKDDAQPKAKACPLRSTVKKDPEPDFKELLKFSLQPEYKFTRLIVPKIERLAPEFDGTSIYRLSKTWTVCDTD